MKILKNKKDSFWLTKEFPLITFAASLITLGLGYWFHCRMEYKRAEMKSACASSVR